MTYQLDGVQYVAVPSGGIGGDMIFYYKEPKAGNLWVFALDGGPKREMAEPNLVTRVGSLPQVGKPGQTLGGRVLPGYGFPATEGGAPIAGEAPPQPTSANPAPGTASAGTPRKPIPLQGTPTPSRTAERCTGRGASDATWPRAAAVREFFARRSIRDGTSRLLRTVCREP